MTWNELVRRGFASAGQVPDEDVLEELGQHAQAMYEAARAK